MKRAGGRPRPVAERHVPHRAVGAESAWRSATRRTPSTGRRRHRHQPALTRGPRGPRGVVQVPRWTSRTTPDLISCGLGPLGLFASLRFARRRRGARRRGHRRRAPAVRARERTTRVRRRPHVHVARRHRRRRRLADTLHFVRLRDRARRRRRRSRHRGLRRGKPPRCRCDDGGRRRWSSSPPACRRPGLARARERHRRGQHAAAGREVQLHALVRRIDDEELRAAARFGVMAVVILPLLPEGPIGPLGGIRAARLWLLVLFFTGLSFTGYLARRIFGAATAIRSRACSAASFRRRT